MNDEIFEKIRKEIKNKLNELYDFKYIKKELLEGELIEKWVIDNIMITETMKSIKENSYKWKIIDEIIIEEMYKKGFALINKEGKQYYEINESNEK